METKCKLTHNVCLCLQGTPQRWVSAGPSSTSSSSGWSLGSGCHNRRLLPMPSSYFSLSRYRQSVDKSITATHKSFLFHFVDIWCIFLFVTQMVSMANEVHSFHIEKIKEVSSFAKSPVIGGLSEEPSLFDILSYSYCYVGIMTGKSVEMSDTYNYVCVRAAYIHGCCCWCSFAFAWILTVVSLCLTLRYMSNIVWVHIVVSIISLHSLFVFLLPSPIQQPNCPPLVPFVLHYPDFPLLSYHCLLNTAFIPLSHPSISLKVRSFATKHTLTGWGSRARRPCLAGCRACSVWSWFPSTALCSWLSTLCFHWPMFAQRISWIRTFSLGIVTMHYCPDNVF